MENELSSGPSLPTTSTTITIDENVHKVKGACCCIFLKEGCGNCNVAATFVRQKIQDALFKVGCFVNRHNLAVSLIGITILLGLCVGLKKVRFETNVEKLWVQDGGKLSKELAYMDKVLGPQAIKSQMEVVIQVNKQKGSNILTVEALEEHLEMMKDVFSMEVEFQHDLWKLSDLCQKPSIGHIGSRLTDQMIQNLLPCLTVTPLDCFWEGSKIAAERTFIPGRSGGRYVSWESMDPWKFVDDLVSSNTSDVPELELKRLYVKAGIKSGYIEKPCLNPMDKGCPATAPNFNLKKTPDVAEVLSDGCTGIATKIMKWPEDLLVGNGRKNKSNVLRSGEALQSIIHLLSPNDIYLKHKHGKGSSVTSWSRERAEEVLNTWQREFTKRVNGIGYNNDSMLTNIMAFSSTSFYDLIKNFSNPNIKQIITGYVLMLVYAILTLRRWTDAVRSFGAVGVVGVLLVTASVAAAMALSSLLQVNFNASSTQVLPFLALGLGVDDMFLMARTYISASQSDDLNEQEITGETLRQSGLSITLTSFTNACAFAMASLIPVPAMQTFARQASLVVIFNWFTVMFLFTAMLGFDIKRVQMQKYDIFCCSGREVRPMRQPTQVQNNNILQDFAFISVEGQPNFPSIYAGANVNAFVKTDNTRQSNNERNQSRGLGTSSSRNMNSNSGGSNVSQGRSRSNSRNKKSCGKIIKKLSLAYFAENYYVPWLQNMAVKVVIVFIFAIFLGVCAYGAVKVQDGLDPSEMVPKTSTEYRFISAQHKYFAFYQMYAVTKEDFNYAENQELLYSYHRAFLKVDAVMRDHDRKLQPFWLMYFRDWLTGLQKTFDDEWAEGRLNQNGWFANASSDATLGYKLLVLTGDPSNPRDTSKLPSARLVDADGIINKACFYHYLTAWYNDDSIGYWASQMGLRPRPPPWNNMRQSKRFPPNSTVHIAPKANPIQIALMPYFVNNLQNTADFVKLIKDVRALCDEYTKKGLPNFPTGIPFNYWELYLHLHGYLWMGVGVVLAATLFVLAASLMNVWAALIIVAVLVMSTFELFGVMGLLGLKLSPVPAVTLIISVGVGVEFTVHVCLVFISSPGDRNERMKIALGKMFAPIVDGALSTLVGIIVLAGSEFDFIVRYFFHLIVAMIVIGLMNGLVLLPVLLSFIGPCCEITHRRVRPSTTSTRSSEISSVPSTNIPWTVSSFSHKNSSTDIQLSNGDWATIPPRGRDRHSSSRNQIAYRDPFGHVLSAQKTCPFNHRRCRYDRKAKTCRGELTPVTEVTTPDSSVSGRPSSESASSKSSRPDTPTPCLPGQPMRTFSSKSKSKGENITRVKATATVTLELCSSSPYRVSRISHGINDNRFRTNMPEPDC